MALWAENKLLINFPCLREERVAAILKGTVYLPYAWELEGQLNRKFEARQYSFLHHTLARTEFINSLAGKSLEVGETVGRIHLICAAYRVGVKTYVKARHQYASLPTFSDERIEECALYEADQVVDEFLKKTTRVDEDFYCQPDSDEPFSFDDQGESVSSSMYNQDPCLVWVKMPSFFVKVVNKFYEAVFPSGEDERLDGDNNKNFFVIRRALNCRAIALQSAFVEKNNGVQSS